MNDNTKCMVQASLCNNIKHVVEALTSTITEMYILDQYSQAIYDLEKLRDNLTIYRTRLVSENKNLYDKIRLNGDYIYNEINNEEN